MEIKIKSLINKLRTSDKKLKIAISIGLVGLLLIAGSEFIPKKSAETQSSVSYDYYVSEMENKTQEIISSIDGVGKCRVMITLKNSNESIYAKNHQENTNDGNYSQENEYVLYENENGESPVLIKEFFPEIKGVAVVCSGADNVKVRESIIESISALYGISTAKISVSKLKD